MPSISSLSITQGCVAQYSDEECYQPLALEKFTAYITKVYFVDDRNSCEVATHNVINKLAAVYNAILKSLSHGFKYRHVLEMLIITRVGTCVSRTF